MRFWDEISQRLAGLSGSATPEEARQALNEFDTRDIQAVRVSEGGGGGSQPFLTAEVTLTDAQIKALGAGGGSGVYTDIVAAPGTGKGLVFQAGFVVVDAAAGAYGNINAAAYMDFELNGGSSVSPQMPHDNLVGLLGGDAELACATFPTWAPAGEVSYFDASQIENLPLSLFTYNASAGAFDGGNAANSARIKVWYTIEDLP